MTDGGDWLCGVCGREANKHNDVDMPDANHAFVARESGRPMHAASMASNVFEPLPTTSSSIDIGDDSGGRAGAVAWPGKVLPHVQRREDTKRKFAESMPALTKSYDRAELDAYQRFKDATAALRCAEAQLASARALVETTLRDLAEYSK